MSKKPHEQVYATNGQKAFKRCKNCRKLLPAQGTNKKDFCDQDCKDQYEQEKREGIEESPLEGSKGVILDE